MFLRHHSQERPPPSSPKLGDPLPSSPKLGDQPPSCIELQWVSFVIPLHCSRSQCQPFSLSINCLSSSLCLVLFDAVVSSSDLLLQQSSQPSTNYHSQQISNRARILFFKPMISLTLSTSFFAKIWFFPSFFFGDFCNFSDRSYVVLVLVVVLVDLSYVILQSFGDFCLSL